MANQYSHLLSPFKIGNITFKNRILGGPLGYNQENLTAAMSQDNVDYYGALARGGAARITTGDCMVSDDAGYNGGGGRPKFYASPMEMMSSLKNYVHTIHRYDCLAFVQLGYNGGDYTNFMNMPGISYGPSPKSFECGAEVIEMDQAMIQRVIGDFVLCTENLRMGGVDGVIIHGGHGAKILDQFRSPLTNHRTDEYGGSLENRCRFGMELMRAVRKAAGDMLVELRVSASEYIDGGLTVDETIDFFKMLEAEHLVDIFHVTGGMHTSPEYNCYCISPGVFPAAPFREDVRKIRAAGIKTPLAIINSVADPDIAEDIIASGDADFVILSRQINLADPYYPRKLREGKPWLIDGCLRCHGCYDVVGPCSVNPYASFKTYESSYELPLAKTPRKVCVVGGGIGGLKAAYTAAERGHRVILFEKEGALGGLLRFADTDTLKLDIRRYKNNMIRRCEEHPNIEIRLNTEATPERIAEELPCGLIVAIGGKQKIPNIPGIDRGNVLGIMESYLQPERMGGHVIMLGSGLTACEMALHLRRCGKKVTIIGRRDDICANESFKVLPTAVFSPIPTFRRMFAEQGIELRLNADVVEITDGGVRVRDVNDDSESLVGGDTVIIAAGMQDRRDEAEQFNDVGAGYFAMVGDCIGPKKIREAVSTAFWAAMEV